MTQSRLRTRSHDKALATAHAQLLQAREELAQPQACSFQDAFLEALRQPFKAAALAHSSSSTRETTSWRRSDLLDFLSLYFPQYAQQPASFSALCASLARKAAKSAEKERNGPQRATKFVDVAFDKLKRVLPRVESKPERRRSIAPFVPGLTSGNENASDETTSTPVLREFQAEVMKKSKSWLGRWRARHLLLHAQTHLQNSSAQFNCQIIRHHSSGASSSASTGNANSRGGDGSSSASSPALTTTGAAAANVKTYDLQDLVSLQLEHVSDGDSASARKAALTLKFQTTLTHSSNSLSNSGATVSQDIKTLILGGGESSDTLVSIRNHIATFALYLELSRRDRLPSMTKVRRYIAAGAMVNVRVRIPRISQSKDSKEGTRRRSQVKQPPRGMVTALQLAFLQDPRVPSFESTIALLLTAGADPRSLLYWDYATQVVFSPPSSDKKEKSEEHHQRRRLRKRLLLLDKVESDGDESAAFQCCEVQADDGARWNLLMYFCWLGDVEGVKQLLIVTGAGSSSGSQGRSSSRQLVTCLDHVNAAGDTALHIAIKSGKETVALLLVEAALSTNAQAVHQCDARGEPVVHLALVARQWHVVDALVAGGAVDPRSYDALGNTALHLAIQLRAPVALIARLIQVYRHLSPTGGLDGRAGRRGSNDTPLSLALKSGQQEVVALLLASGASPSGSECQWSQAFIGKRDTRNEEDADERAVVGDDDSALHVAIKAGMELAAAALIAHKADIYLVDSRGASSLALAVRYGLYALAAALVDQHQKKPNQSASKHWWVDGETGRPVAMLAFQAGQLELAALLLDCISQGTDSQRQMYPARILPLLMRISSWLGASIGANSDSVVSNKSSFSRRKSGGSVDDGDRKSAERKMTRKQMKRETSRHSGNSSAASAFPEEDRDVCSFLLRGIQSLVVRFLHLSGKTSVPEVIGGGTMPTSVSLSTLPLEIHLPTTATPTKSSPPKVFKDDELAKVSPLHVAAGSAAAQVLVRPMGLRTETALHAALAAGAAENALLLLYSSRELQVRSPAVGPVCAQILEMTNSLGDSALHLACTWPHSASMRLVVEMLLQEHVDTGNWNNAGLAPLHVALREECDDSFIELFSRYGQDLNLWTEGNTYEDEEDDEFTNNGARPSAVTMVTSCPQNPLMLAVESENASAFRALVRGGARTRALMPRARIGLLQLAVHFKVRDPELLACLLDDPELEHAAHSDVADQWGVSPREARSRLMEVWRKERSGVDVQETSGDRPSANTDKNTEEDPFGSRNRPPPLHPASSSGELLTYSSMSSDYSSSIDSSTQSADTRAPPPLRISVPRPPAESVPLETAQYLRALPRPPTLSPTTLEYLREEERATLTLVAQEARSEAQDWLAKRIGQKKLLSDAHAQLHNAKTHRRTASGSSVSSSRDDLEASYESTQSDQQLLEELKAAAAKKFIEKHVAEAVAEARLSIEREKQTIFQETGLYPGMTSASKKNKKKEDGRHRSLLVRAASSTTGSMLLPASSASVTSVSSEEGSSTQLSDDSYGVPAFGGLSAVLHF
ncbi:Ankyrin repeat-containing domain [Phytophthora cactorum]|nr:Ankyrin repeat-containing domain [Phytophthora cactorum]